MLENKKVLNCHTLSSDLINDKDGTQQHIEKNKMEQTVSRIDRQETINKSTLLMLTSFLGGAGVHKFYLKQYLQGTVYLIFSWTIIPCIISIFDFFNYTSTSEEKLQSRYPEKGSRRAVLLSSCIGVIIFIALISTISVLIFLAVAGYWSQ